MLILRKNAPLFLQNVILGFAFSVIAIRLYLQFSPITIVVVGDFHVAHMLYGGVLLFVAALLLLIFQNSKMLNVASWLAGIGFGFFIDEIGKYVSLNNDYYYKLAAPLIYLAFLLTLFVFFLIQRRQQPTIIERLHHALFDVQKLFEGQLLYSDFTLLKKNLRELTKRSSQPWHQVLATALYDAVKQSPAEMDWAEESKLYELQLRVRGQARELLYRRWIRGMVYLIFAVRILWVIPGLILPLLSFSRGTIDGDVRINLINAGLISGSSEFFPFLMTALIEVLVALGLLFALSLIVLRQPGGYWLARRLLLFSILFLGLFNIYFGQFSALISIGIDAALLFVLTKLYTRRYA
jgi:hypothetical protein